MPHKLLPITCPLCGRKTEYPMENLKEGVTITCPFCKVKLNLHGHMWAEIQTEKAKLESTESGEA